MFCEQIFTIRNGEGAAVAGSYIINAERVVMRREARRSQPRSEAMASDTFHSRQRPRGSLRHPVSEDSTSKATWKESGWRKEPTEGPFSAGADGGPGRRVSVLRNAPLSLGA